MGRSTPLFWTCALVSCKVEYKVLNLIHDGRGEIIVYSQYTINACTFLSHKWWVPLIKFMVGSTIYVRGGSTHLWYSWST